MAHSMTPSLANPYLFIYKGAELPRKNSIKDKDGNAHPGGLNFKVGPQSAGCYTFGSTADAIRGSYDGCLDIAESDGSSSNLVVISFLFQLSSSFLILLKVVDMFAF